MAFRNALPLWERRLSGDGVVALEGRGHELLDAGEKKRSLLMGRRTDRRFDAIVAQSVEEGALTYLASGVADAPSLLLPIVLDYAR